MLRTITATRYVTPLREGGSLPAIIEADDDGLYVLKFRNAGQGPRSLVAELIVGELARALSLPVPEIVFANLDAALGRAEPHPEIQEIVMRSEGLNLALDYLPGSVTFNPAADESPAAGLAADIVWFDSFVTNPDRMPQNPNMLTWHNKLWLIDHGAALYVHHGWANPEADALQAFEMVARHVLLPFAGDIAAADARLVPQLTPELVASVVGMVPDAWLVDDPHQREPAEQRAAYIDYLQRRIAGREAFVTAAVNAAATATVDQPATLPRQSLGLSRALGTVGASGQVDNG